MSETIKAFHCVVHGIVQGVAFRYHTRHEARSLNLVGYVRNLSDGTVELLAEGTASSLEILRAWLNHGPPAARVDRVDFDWRTPTNQFREFQITY